MTSATYVKSLDQYKYLVKNGKIPGLNRGGQVVKSHPTTTKRIQITVTQQLQWHMLVEDLWDRMRETNLPPDSFVNHMEHFQLDLEESCIMANDGSLIIIGGYDRKKHEKRVDDSLLSLTLIIVENYSGNEGPWIFLYKVKSNPNNDISGVALFSQHSAPVGSHFYPTPNEYLTGNAWLELSTIISDGIRLMPVIRYHTYWWLSFSLDVFGYHVNVNAANENFTKLNI